MAEYDQAQRERIREALLAYVKEHKIGIPTLGIAALQRDRPRPGVVDRGGA